MFEQHRTKILVVALIIIGALLYFLNDTKTGVSREAEIKAGEDTSIVKSMMYPRVKEIVNPHGFINTDGKEIKIADYVGKNVILVDFWTYSCINCIRVQPYLNAWYDKYADQGLVIVGMHTPEFEFEKIFENVARETEKAGIKYPVVLDNDYGTWQAYQNRYWPRKYLVDIDGYIVYDHIGEGGYEETERKIQELLKERLARLGEGDGIASDVVAPEGVETVADRMPRTPEIYFGASRNASYLANGEGGKTGTQNFSAPEKLQTSALYLDGPWMISPEYAEGDAGSSIKIRFQGKKVFIVASSDAGANVKVLVDGEVVSDDLRGSDVGVNGIMHIKDEQLYRVIESDVWGEHTLELEIQNGTLEIFTFTFG